jgi:hypothetical protein
MNQGQPGTNTAPSSTTAPAGNSGGMGSNWSWIGDIVQTIGGVAVAGIGADQNNRAYKYNLWQPLQTTDTSQTRTMLIIGAIAVVFIMFLFIGLNSVKNDS